MKNIIVIIFSVLVIIEAKAQYSVRYTFGYGIYVMGDMKDLLKTMELSDEAQRYNLKIVDNFPGYITHSLDVGYRKLNHEFGIKSSFLTTGGKLSVADYSGNLESKITINGFREGLVYRNYFYEIAKNGVQKFSMFAELSPSVIVTRLKIKETGYIGSDVLTATDKSFTKIAFSLQPQIGICYDVLARISLNISFGYELATYAHVKELPNYDNINWNGFRAGIGVGVKL